METKKHELIQRTLDYFLKYGSKNVTMDDIASEFGVSKKTIYSCFKNKEELVRDCTQFLWERFLEELDKIEVKDPIRKIILIYQKVIEHISSIRPVFVFSLKKYHKESFEDYDLYKVYFRDHIVLPLLKQAQEEGKIDTEVLLELFYQVNFDDIGERLWQLKFFEEYSNKMALEYFVIQKLKGIVKVDYLDLFLFS
ncbi:hypothetical protein DI487_06250 [Flavobacterium sediminis]|uniref:HTH tetR-type domain-containing protein n=1 Tax=Flavobacterium sediminis TaxID=2201181 RepID=A0A2U8QTI7_9FLAO|nr:TetR/AcrR family transcriptional regulator [Flavobacterium sediminis]AWM13500.1 hypothetical protein DI487_06250 [Flavobacterium sediminis]